MTDEGIKKCFGALNGAYKNSYKEMTAGDWSIMKEVWQIQFANADDLAVFIALNKCVSKCKFPPSIAEIKEAMLPEDDFNEEEAWDLVWEAGKNGNYGAYEEYEKLPETIRSIITPGTLMEIANADNESLRFIKRDVVERLRIKHKKKADRLLSGFTDRHFLTRDDVMMLESDEDIMGLPFNEE